jgi:hypothetical protein
MTLPDLISEQNIQLTASTMWDFLMLNLAVSKETDRL